MRATEFICECPLNENLRAWFAKVKKVASGGGGWDRYNTQR